MAENQFFIDSDKLSEAALERKHKLETDPSSRTNHMEYMPGMEQIDPTIRNKVLSEMDSYDYNKYTARDVQNALEHETCSVEDFKALLSPAAEPFLERMAQRAKIETGKHFGNTGLSERMLRHTQDFKEGRWSPVISGKVVWAMRNAKSEQEFRELLKQEHIDVVFRRNDTGRIYGVTFIDHERREAFNGSRMGKEFSANVFNGLVNWWEEIPWQDRQQSGPEELWKRYGHRMEENSALEQAAGIFSFEANPAIDYEEEAFRRRMKRKKKPQKRKSRGI